MQTGTSKLRALASWYRDFAEKAGNPAIWEAQLRTADKPEAEAELAERTQARGNRDHDQAVEKAA